MAWPTLISRPYNKRNRVIVLSLLAVFLMFFVVLISDNHLGSQTNQLLTGSFFGAVLIGVIGLLVSWIKDTEMTEKNKYNCFDKYIMQFSLITAPDNKNIHMGTTFGELFSSSSMELIEKGHVTPENDLELYKLLININNAVVNYNHSVNKFNKVSLGTIENTQFLVTNIDESLIPKFKQILLIRDQSFSRIRRK